MAKRALIIHPNNDYNCGDQLTFLGTKALLAQALGGSEKLDVVQFDMQRAECELDTYVSEFCWGKIDIVALAGSPWIWHGCELTPKYQLIIDAVKRFPDAKKVALGLGSCFSREAYYHLSKSNTDHWFNNVGKKFINEFYGQFDYILVRDWLAYQMFANAGVNVHYTYDTSAYAKYFLGRGENKGARKVLWFYDPTKGVSKNALSFDPEHYIQYQLDWAKQHHADIYCNSDSDMQTLMQREVSANFTVDLVHLRAKLQDYSEMLTGRVHMGVLAHLAGVPKITVLPVDSRYLTVLPFGLEIHFIDAHWDSPACEIDVPVEEQEKAVIEELRNIL